MDCFKSKEEELLDEHGKLKYKYPEVVSSFYKGPKGNLIKMYSLKNNYPLLKRKECNELRFEYFFSLAMEKFYSCVGLTENKVTDESDSQNKQRIITIQSEEQQKIAQLHLEAGLNQEKKKEFLKQAENRRRSLLPPVILNQPPPVPFNIRRADPGYIDQRLRRESQFSKIPLNSPMY